MIVQVLRSAWIWGSCSALVLLWTPLLFIVKLFERDPLRRRTARWLRRLGPVVAKVNPAWRVHVSGAELIDSGAVYVVVSNHQSLADIPLVAHLKIEAKWLAKIELFQFPVFGWMLTQSGHVPVDRANSRKAAQSLVAVRQISPSAMLRGVFPEGTRTETGEVLPFNNGPFQLALREKCAVLPLVIEGTGSALPRATWMFGGTQDIQLRVLEPLSPEICATFDIQGLREEVRGRIVRELQRLRTS